MLVVPLTTTYIFVLSYIGHQIYLLNKGFAFLKSCIKTILVQIISQEETKMYVCDGKKL